MVSAKVEIRYDTLWQSAEANVSDHKYEVEHNKPNRPEIPRSGGGKKENKIITRMIELFVFHMQ